MAEGYTSPQMYMLPLRTSGSMLVGSAIFDPADDPITLTFTHQDDEPGNGVTALENAEDWGSSF